MYPGLVNVMRSNGSPDRPLEDVTLDELMGGGLEALLNASDNDDESGSEQSGGAPQPDLSDGEQEASQDDWDDEEEVEVEDEDEEEGEVVEGANDASANSAEEDDSAEGDDDEVLAGDHGEADAQQDGIRGEGEEDPEVADLSHEVQRHQDQLAKLKERDPEFFKFLEREDSGLLHFEDDDQEGEGNEGGEDEDEDEGEEEEGKDQGRGAARPSPDSEELPAGGEASLPELTRATIRAWAKLLEKVGGRWHYLVAAGRSFRPSRGGAACVYPATGASAAPHCSRVCSGIVWI